MKARFVFLQNFLSCSQKVQTFFRHREDFNAHYLIVMLAVSVSWSIEACRLMFPFGWSSPRSSGLGVKIFAVTSSSSDPSLSDLDSDGGA